MAKYVLDVIKNLSKKIEYIEAYLETQGNIFKALSADGSCLASL